MKMLLSVILALIVSTGSVNAQDFVWPLDIPVSKSSSFAEFRGMRFHAGIDLRTQRKTGFPVYAVADGFVSRMKVEFRGYGYALYIDHPQHKMRVVFAHLENFAGPMARYAEDKLQKKKKRFGIDDFFSQDKFPVKRGQVVAYTGDTGSGPPHLHFEIRRMNDDPISLSEAGFAIPDDRPPDMVALYLDPLSEATTINGGFLPVEIPFEKSGPGRYTWKSVPQISGKTGVQAGIVDTNDVGNRFGVELIVMKLDGNEIFRREFSRFSYSEMSQCPWVYDYLRSNRSGAGYVYTLFKWPFETTSFSAGYGAWDGVIGDVSPGWRELTIEAVDAGGNRVSATGLIEIVSAPVEEIIVESGLILKKTHYNIFSVVAEGEYTGPAGREITHAVCMAADGNVYKVPARIKGKTVQVAFPVLPLWQGGASIGGKKFLLQHTYLGTEGGRVRMEPGGEVVFPAGALNFPVLARFTRTNLKPPAGGSKKGGILPALSPLWRLFPDNLIAAKSYSIHIALPRTQDLKRIGFYARSGGYLHLGGSPQGDRMVYSARYAGELGLLDDTVKPAVSYKESRKLARIGPAWVFSVSDIGEGVGYLASKATVDGKEAETYGDPDKAEVYVIKPPGKGTRKIKLTVFDNAGNASEISTNRQ